MKISEKSLKRTRRCQLPHQDRGCKGAVKYVGDTRLCYRHRLILDAIVADSLSGFPRAPKQKFQNDLGKTMKMFADAHVSTTTSKAAA